MLRKIMPHVAIILSMMYFVFFCIDRVNSAMCFINNDITKWLLVILALVSIFNAVLLVVDNQKRAERKENRARARRPESDAVNPVPARSAYSGYTARTSADSAPVRRTTAPRHSSDYAYRGRSDYR